MRMGTVYITDGSPTRIPSSVYQYSSHLFLLPKKDISVIIWGRI